MADLHFPRTWKSEGLSVQSMAQHDGSADPVVRELLQNSLDAARRAGRATRERPLRVTFTIKEWPVGELPGIAAYRRAFETVQREQTEGEDTPAAAETVRRIRRALDSEWTQILFCTDNGHGLNRDRMRAILSEARGDKGGDQLAGSYGLGHLTAFAASDLRYVLYGGLSSQGPCVSAHAILASHVDVEAGIHRAGEGFWTHEPEPALHSCDFPKEVPALLDEEADLIAGEDGSGTGTVVCIAGFNRFRERKDEAAVERILRVAATNFVGAIARGEMELEVLAELSSVNLEKRLDRRTLRAQLERHSGQKRSRRGSGGGWLPGAQAFEAWQTLNDGRRLEDTGRGVDVRLRSLDVASGAGSRVNVFRNGMWITNSAPELLPGNFVKARPFDAVVLLEEGGLFDLVRASEGPEHRGIDPKRLSTERRRKLREKLKALAQRLEKEAGKAAAGDRFRPPGFAVFEGPKPAQGRTDPPREAPAEPRGRRPRRAPAGARAGSKTEARRAESQRPQAWNRAVGASLLPPAVERRRTRRPGDGQTRGPRRPTDQGVRTRVTAPTGLRLRRLRRAAVPAGLARPPLGRDRRRRNGRRRRQGPDPTAERKRQGSHPAGRRLPAHRPSLQTACRHPRASRRPRSPDAEGGTEGRFQGGAVIPPLHQNSASRQGQGRRLDERRAT